MIDSLLRMFTSPEIIVIVFVAGWIFGVWTVRRKREKMLKIRREELEKKLSKPKWEEEDRVSEIKSQMVERMNCWDEN